jgi:Adenylate and Guanylate cyclase catalytic domain
MYPCTCAREFDVSLLHTYMSHSLSSHTSLSLPFFLSLLLPLPMRVVTVLYCATIATITQATIMFADIVGFTAWSSVREPSQVFTLLETVYKVFDDIARQHGVFKVETVGDCYVAVAGLPEARRDHAVVMVRFAYDCLKKTGDITK